MDNDKRPSLDGQEDLKEETRTSQVPAPTVTDEEAESALSRAFRQYEADPGSDTFIETIVRKKMMGQDYAKIAGIFVLYFILLFASFILMNIFPVIITFMPLIFIGGAFGAWWLVSSLNKEFEYVVTNGDLDIDVITARRRRKRAYSVKAKDIEIMAACASDDYKTYEKQQNLNVKKLAANPEDPKNWFIVSQYQGARVMAILSADEKVIKSIHRHARHRVRYNPVVGI